jgi:hypothetical protein
MNERDLGDDQVDGQPTSLMEPPRRFGVIGGGNERGPGRSAVADLISDTPESGEPADGVPREMVVVQRGSSWMVNVVVKRMGLAH